MMRAHQPGSQPIDVPETIPNPAVPRTVPNPEPRPSEPIKVHAPQHLLCFSWLPRALPYLPRARRGSIDSSAPSALEAQSSLQKNFPSRPRHAS